MLRLIAIILVFLSSLPINSQTPFPFLKHDYIWLGGYSTPDGIKYRGFFIDFNTQPPTVSFEYIGLPLEITNAVIADYNGNLLFYCNGSKVSNSHHELMENGDSINPGNTYPIYNDIIVQGDIILPFPNHDNQYYLIHKETKSVEDLDGNTYANLKMYATLVDMSMNDELGKVISKNNLLVNDTLDYGKITATRHANGRDWWIITGEYGSNGYYLFLLTPEGIIPYPIQYVGDNVISGVGQSVFSPDGSKFISINTVGIEYDVYVDIYDFDRCNGLLSNHLKIHPASGLVGDGIAISPNSRFLYVNIINKIYQYDLWATDIESTETLIALFDGYVSPAPTYFFLGQLAPDNKIYIASWSTNSVMHVFHNPDEQGLACNFEQHGLQLPAHNNGTIPNNPNFRLGPLDGSPCDTLGIDNYPFADFDYRTQENTVYFRDISFFNPENRTWNFGDGQTSEAVHPVHTFESPGTYEVCLTVSNENSSDTHCKTVNVGINDIDNPHLIEKNHKVFPNPVTDYLNVQIYQPIKKQEVLILSDNLGRTISKYPLFKGFQNFKIPMYKLPTGIYYYQIIADTVSVGHGKIIKR